MFITSKGVLKKVSLVWLILFKTGKADFFSRGAFLTIAIPLWWRSSNHLIRPSSEEIISSWSIQIVSKLPSNELFQSWYGEIYFLLFFIV